MPEVLSQPRQDTKAWKIERFKELGFGQEDAELLEYAGVDWHAAQRLLERGCTHELAFTILV